MNLEEAPPTTLGPRLAEAITRDTGVTRRDLLNAFAVVRASASSDRRRG